MWLETNVIVIIADYLMTQLCMWGGKLLNSTENIFIYPFMQRDFLRTVNSGNAEVEITFRH